MTLQHDHALALYPVPHVLVLADSVAADWTRFEGCDVFNPVRHPSCWRQRRCPCECMAMRSRSCVQRIIGEVHSPKYRSQTIADCSSRAYLSLSA